MGLFDKLPPPSAKRPAPGAEDTVHFEESKKPRVEEPAGQSAAPSLSLLCTPIAAAYSEDKGSRLTMEDVAVICLEAGKAGTPDGSVAAASSTPSGPCAAPATSAAPGVRLSFFAIMDGHAGSNVARYAAEHLNTTVLAAGLGAEAERLAAGAAAGGGKAQLPSVKQCKAAIAEGFKELDRRVLEQCAAKGWPDGSTAVAAWVLGDTVLVANVGDARCVLARRPAAAAAADSARAAAAGGAVAEAPAAAGATPGKAGGDAAAAAGETQQGRSNPEQGSSAPQQDACTAQQGSGTQDRDAGTAQQAQQQPQQAQQQRLEPLKAITLTREHKAIFLQERQRIESAGSFVSTDGRLAGRIEVSRAFGDRQFKRSGMSAVPDVQAFQISGRDAFLLLACDGFWGVFSPQDAVEFAQRELWTKGHSVKQTCNRLIHEAIRERRCKDNCTVMMVQLQHPAG